MVKGLRKIGVPNTIGETCMKGKKHQTPFLKMGKWRTKLDCEENIEIDKNAVEGGGITEETTELVAETIEPVVENEEGKIMEEMTESVAETIEPVAENSCTRFDNKGGEKSTSTQREELSDLNGFTDNDYAIDMEDSNSTSDYVFMMSGGAVAWSSRIVTLSTTEAEFVAASACACQAVWMKMILKEIGHSQIEGTKLMCDNTSY
ncbi:uncharacterized protein LOC111470570 [Cucurbita maxima]|uniref:Uncharacterized protein LOC111470570 n=1 Tax=Cucurbita maxima TaxID=3661 RepID=A0A6J1I4E9_CUCMA|nr:uncharacterized protein LOC111470570 [Cucurbita maxima]